MPFQSEAQRRYLWANEPEIARDWTDTYGSGIAKALGGRIGFYRGSSSSSRSSSGPGPGGQSSDRGGSLSGRGRSAPSGGGGHHSGGDHRGPTTYTPPKQLTVTRPSHHIGAGDISQNYNKNLRNLQRQQEYQQGAYQRAHPFLSKIKSGLGSLGRGIGHVARNFNPLSLAFDNPYMKLLMSGYGRGNMKNLFQRNDQTTEQMNPELAKYFSGMGIADSNILPKDKPTDSLMDDRTLMAELNRNEKTELGVLQTQKESEDIFGPLTPKQEQRMKELLQKELEV